jgi:hypothetical protein
MFIDSLQTKYFDCVASKFTILTRFRFITDLLKTIAVIKQQRSPVKRKETFNFTLVGF